MDKKYFEEGFKQRNGRKYSILMIFPQLILFYRCINSSVIGYNDDGNIYLKGYFAVLEESKENSRCLEEYKKQLCDFIRQKKPEADFKISHYYHPQGMQLWLLGMTFQYSSTRGYSLLDYQDISSSYLIFKNMEDLLMCAKRVCDAQADPRVLQWYRKECSKLEEERGLGVPNVLKTLISQEMARMESPSTNGYLEAAYDMS